MANVSIPQLPAATSLNGTEQFPATQTGTLVRITTSQLLTLVGTTANLTVGQSRVIGAPSGSVLGVSGSSLSAYGTTGSGNVVLASNPTLVTPSLDTPTSITLTNATGLPLTTGVTGQLGFANGGTGQSSAAAVLTALNLNASRVLIGYTLGWMPGTTQEVQLTIPTVPAGSFMVAAVYVYSVSGSPAFGSETLNVFTATGGGGTKVTSRADGNSNNTATALQSGGVPNGSIVDLGNEIQWALYAAGVSSATVATPNPVFASNTNLFARVSATTHWGAWECDVYAVGVILPFGP